MRARVAMRHVDSHLNGKPTEASKTILGKVHAALIQAGFKPPFRIKRAQLQKLFESMIDPGTYETNATVFRDGYPLLVSVSIEYNGENADGISAHNLMTGNPIALNQEEMERIYSEWRDGEIARKDEMSRKLYDDLLDLESTKKGPDTINLGDYR